MERVSSDDDDVARPSNKDIGAIGKVRDVNEAQRTPANNRDPRTSKDSTGVTDNDDVLVDESLASEKLQVVQDRQRSRSIIDSGGLNGSDSENEQEHGYSTSIGASIVRRSDDVDAVITTHSEINFDDGVPVATLPMDATCYNMKHKRRGKCEVFNHKKFNDYDTREGTEVDAERIKKTFGKLGFTVNVHDDFTYNQIKKKLDELQAEDHGDSDCLCIFVLTHGLNGDLLCARDVSYKRHFIWKTFIGSNCKTLIGKPKLFFFQACRGDKADHGVAVRCDSRVTETDSGVAYRLPTHSDFLIANSTIEGFYTWRNPNNGTWYIQCLCDVIDQWAPTTDLLKMLTITARKVATEYMSYNPQDPSKHNKKQIPSLTSMLIRDVYFYTQSKETDL